MLCAIICCLEAVTEVACCLLEAVLISEADLADLAAMSEAKYEAELWVSPLDMLEALAYLSLASVAS
jgi:hypothetical protein